MIRLTHLWRYLILILVTCCILYLTLQHIQHIDNQDFVPKSRILLSEQQKVYLHGIDFTSKLPKIQYTFDPQEERTLLEEKRQAIKASFLHAWTGYKTYALGQDELKPLTNTGHNPFGGLCATIIDSLSTMLIMDMEDEIDQLLPITEKIQFKVDDQLSVFETTIRLMGGFLSAYELSNHPRKHVFLDKAQEIGLMLLPAFDTHFGLPFYKFNPVTNSSRSHSTYLADMGTLQLEFFTLSFHTGNHIFAEKAQAITQFIDTSGYAHGISIPGLYPYEIDISKGRFRNGIISFGAMGDSAYEYFLKEYILSDGQVPQYARMYQQSIDSMKTHMLFQLPGSKLLYLPNYDTALKKPTSSMDHLACFAPGMLAMGSKIFNRPDDMIIAKGLLETCVHMYRSSPTHLSPESWGTANNMTQYNPLTYGKSDQELKASQEWWTNDTRPPAQRIQTPGSTLEDIEETTRMTIFDPHYHLRPETIESLYIMYRVTGDPIYQEYGWMIYEALETHCKTTSGYASLKNVQKPSIITPLYNQIDTMETFLLAETFKYLYLLFSSPDIISLDKFVLNTEAHPILRRPWSFNI